MTPTPHHSPPAPYLRDRASPCRCEPTGRAEASGPPESADHPALSEIDLASSSKSWWRRVGAPPSGEAMERAAISMQLRSRVFPGQTAALLQ